METPKIPTAISESRPPPPQKNRVSFWGQASQNGGVTPTLIPSDPSFCLRLFRTFMAQHKRIYCTLTTNPRRLMGLPWRVAAWSMSVRRWVLRPSRRLRLIAKRTSNLAARRCRLSPGCAVLADLIKQSLKPRGPNGPLCYYVYSTMYLYWFNTTTSIYSTARQGQHKIGIPYRWTGMNGIENRH